MKATVRRDLRLVTLLMGLCLSMGLAVGCTSSRLSKSYHRSIDKLVAARGVDPEGVVFPDRLSEEMKRWLHGRYPRRAQSEQVLFRLLEYLESSQGPHLQYAAGYTGTAQEVFESGKYNCLSFSHLFLALGRELGVDARYLSVGRIRRYRKEGDVVIVSGHVTVGFGVGTEKRVLEFNVGPDVNYQTATPISDLTALALFYGNRGGELIQARKPAEAVEWLTTATRLDSRLPGPWVNLGVAKRRLGRLQEAEQAYWKAIEIDQEFFPAYRNLAGLYALLDRGDVVEEMLQILERRGNDNPYAFLALGDYRLKQEQFDGAQAFYRRALRLSEEKAEAQAALGQLALRQGALAEAQQWLDKAQDSDPRIPRVVELRQALLPESSEPREVIRPRWIE